MTWLCCKCGRKLVKPGAVYAGKVYGPDCAKSAGIVTVKLKKADRLARVKRTKPVKVEIDQLDLFEGVRNDAAIH